jgi:hypothetical protein
MSSIFGVNKGIGNAAKSNHLLNNIVLDETKAILDRTKNQIDEINGILDLYKHYEKVSESTIINQKLNNLTPNEIIDQRSKPIISISTLSTKEQEKILEKIVQISNVDDDEDGFKNSIYNYNFLTESEISTASSTANALPTNNASDYELKKLAESMLKQGQDLKSMLHGMSPSQRRSYLSSIPDDEELVSKKVMFMILSPVAAIMVTWVSVNLIPATLAASMGLNPLMLLMKTYTIISSAENGRNIQEALQIMLRTGTKELINFGVTFVFGMLSYRGGPTTVATDAAAAAIGSMGKLEQMWSLLGYIPFSRMIMHVTQDGVQLFMSKIEFFKETDHEIFLKQQAKKQEKEFKKQQGEKKELIDWMNVIDGKTESESSFYQEKLDAANKVYESGKKKVQTYTKSHPVIATIFLIVFSSALSNYIIDDVVGVGGSITESIFKYVPLGTYITGAASSLIDKQMVVNMIKFSLTPTIIGWLNNILPIKKQIIEKLQKKFFKNNNELLTADQVMQGQFTKARLAKTIFYYFTNVFISVSIDELIRNGINTDFVKLAENHVWKHMPQPVKDMFSNALSGLKYGVSIPFLILAGRNIFSGTDQATADANRLELEALIKELTDTTTFANAASDIAINAVGDLNAFQQSGVAKGLPDLEAAMGSARGAAEAAAAAAKAAADTLAALGSKLGIEGIAGIEAARKAAQDARNAAQAALSAAALANRLATQNAINSAERRKGAINSQDRTLTQADENLEKLENLQAQINKDKLALEGSDQKMQALRLQLAGLEASKLKNPGTTQYDTGIAALQGQLTALERDFVSAALKIQMQLNSMKGIIDQMGSVMSDMSGFMLTDMQGIYSRASGILSSASSVYANVMRSIATMRNANKGLFALLEEACRGIGQNINGQGTPEQFTEFQQKQQGLNQRNKDLSSREQKLTSMLESLDRTISSANTVLTGQKDDNTLGTVRIGDLRTALGNWNRDRAALAAQLATVRTELSTLNELLILGNGLELNFLSSNLASFNKIFGKLATYANFGPKGLVPIPSISDQSIFGKILEESRNQRQQIKTYNGLRNKFNDFANGIGQTPIPDIPFTDLLNDSTLGQKILLLQSLTDKTGELESYMNLIKDRHSLLAGLNSEGVLSGMCGSVPCHTLASAEMTNINRHLGILNSLFGDISGGITSVPKTSFFGMIAEASGFGKTFDSAGILSRLNGILSGKIIFNPALDSNPNIQEYNLMRETLGDQYDNFIKYQVRALQEQARDMTQAADVRARLTRDLRIGHISRILREKGLGGREYYQKYKKILDVAVPLLDEQKGEHNRKVQEIKILGRSAKRLVDKGNGSTRGGKTDDAWHNDVDKLMTDADNSYDNIEANFDKIIIGMFNSKETSTTATQKIGKLFGQLRNSISGIEGKMKTLYGQINSLYDPLAVAAAALAAAERQRIKEEADAAKKIADDAAEARRIAAEQGAAVTAAAATAAAATATIQDEEIEVQVEGNKHPEPTKQPVPEQPQNVPQQPKPVPEQPKPKEDVPEKPKPKEAVPEKPKPKQAVPEKPKPKEDVPEKPKPKEAPPGPINLPVGHPLHGLTPQEVQAYAANRLSILNKFSTEFTGPGYQNLRDLLTAYTQAQALGTGLEVNPSQFQLIEQTLQTIKDGMHTGDKVIDEQIDAIINSPEFEDMSMGSLVGLMTTLSQFRIHLAQSAALQAASQFGWVAGPGIAAVTNTVAGAINSARTYLNHYDIAASYYDQLAPFLKLGDLDKRATQLNIWRGWLGRKVGSVKENKFVKVASTGYSYDVPNSNGVELARLFIRIGLAGKGGKLKDVFWNRLFTPDPSWVPGKETYDKLSGLADDLARLALRDSSFRDMLFGSNLDISVMNGINSRAEIDAYLQGTARTDRDAAIRKLAHAGKEIWHNHFDFLYKACSGTKGYEIDAGMKSWLCKLDEHGVHIYGRWYRERGSRVKY